MHIVPSWPLRRPHWVDVTQLQRCMCCRCRLVVWQWSGGSGWYTVPCWHVRQRRRRVPVVQCRPVWRHRWRGHCRLQRRVCCRRGLVLWLRHDRSCGNAVPCWTDVHRRQPAVLHRLCAAAAATTADCTAACKPGKFSAAGAAVCTLCPRGQYSTTPGGSTCSACNAAPGFYCPAGGVAPAGYPCPAGERQASRPCAR